MPKFAANLSMMFKEVDFLDRFEKAADAGFKAVEFLFPYDYDADEIATLLNDNNLELVLFNTSAGNSDKDEWGLTALPDRIEEARTMIDTALDYAIKLNCQRVHIMAGVVPTKENKNDYENTFVDNMRYAADLFSQKNRNVVIEALSPPIKPNYLFSSQHDALRLVRKIDRPNVGVQYDFFHAQLVDGNIASFLTDNINWIKHIQIASVPHRHEPDQGEINYPWLFDLLDTLKYDGWVGCEYNPFGKTEDGLTWLKTYQ